MKLSKAEEVLRREAARALIEVQPGYIDYVRDCLDTLEVLNNIDDERYRVQNPDFDLEI